MRQVAVLLLLIAFGFSSVIMLYQTYAHSLPTIAYYSALSLFVGAIIASIMFGSEALAVTGVFSFYMIVRLMFYVSTRFLVFPFGDPYGQFGVLEGFAQSSHANILFPTKHVFDETRYLAVLTNQYSQWPGFQILTLSLANISGLPLLVTAISMTLLLDIVWFAAAYCLIRKILSGMNLNLPNPTALCLAAFSSLPSSAPIPSYFKYDFVAGIYMLVGILLLIRFYDHLDRKITPVLIILSAAITITHSITAMLWLVILTALVVWNTVVHPLAKSFPSPLKTLLTDRRVRVSLQPLYTSITSLFIFVAVSTASWWTFYAVFMETYLKVSLPKILGTISLSSLSQSRLASGQIGLSALTPHWIIELLGLRDRVLLALLVAGVLTILLRHSLIKRAHLRILMLTVAAIALSTELSGALSFGDRAFELFAPLLGVLILAPLIVLGLIRRRFGRIAAVGLLALFMFTIGIGFWGSSYAPTGLYTYGSDPSSASGRPLSWPAVASFMSYSGNQSCILTNEIYATSLSVPVSDWNNTKLVGTVKIAPGCLTIVFNGLYSTVNANVSAFGFGEPNAPYPGFSPSVFYGNLNNNSDRIFDTGTVTNFYYP